MLALQGWHGVQTIPRTITYDAELDELLFYPVVEVEQLRQEALYEGNVTLDQVGLITLLYLVLHYLLHNIHCVMLSIAVSDVTSSLWTMSGSCSAPAAGRGTIYNDTYVTAKQSLCCAVLCCAVLCCAVLCCAVLCCAVLCCAWSIIIRCTCTTLHVHIR